MKIYQDTATHNQSIFTYEGVTEEMVIRQQIQRLINEIPFEDLLKVFTVEQVTEFHPYFRGYDRKITVKIKI
jgi:hypothetical protein